MTKVKLTFTSIAAILFLAITNINAQTKNEAIIAFNEGVRMEKADSVAEAIVAFEKSIGISEQVGDSAVEVKNLAIQELPKLYYLKAKALANDKKWQEAVAVSKEAIKVGEKYSIDKYKDPSEKLLAQGYLVIGSTLAKNKENDKAIKTLDSAISINPNYIKAYQNKALIYMNMDNTDKFLETSNIVIEKANAETDMATANQMKKLSYDYLKKAGGKNLKANKLSEAISNLNAALKYGEDPDIYYYFASAYNKQKKYDEAITNANKGLELETGTAEAKAKYYYELATAQLGKGDKENACGNFKKANYGPFVQAVKAQLTNLQCK